MKKVLVVDWLDMYGGAERVIKSLCNVFSFEKCYVLIDLMSKDNKQKLFSHKAITIEQTYLKYAGSRFRYFFPFFGRFIDSVKIEADTDLIISSSHAIAKGVRKSRESQVHISYFQARNQKYLWDDYDLYFGKAKIFINPFKKKLQASDFRAAQNPDFIISNSHFVKNWVKKTYNRDSIVIYPPVDLSQFHFQNEKEDYFVTVGRIEPYKRFDIVIETFTKLNKKLIVIGDGSQLNSLKKKAGKNIQFTGFLESREVYAYISKAKGFVHAGIEDFGIAPIEAQACGTPVIAYGFGGVLETVIENKTGVFFKEQNSGSLLQAIKVFNSIDFNFKEISKNAERFSVSNFEKKIEAYVEEKLS